MDEIAWYDDEEGCYTLIYTVKDWFDFPAYHRGGGVTYHPKTLLRRTVDGVAWVDDHGPKNFLPEYKGTITFKGGGPLSEKVIVM